LRGSEADTGDKEQVDQQDGDEDEASDDDVERAEAEDSLLGVLGKIGRRNMVLAVMVAVVGFGHGYQVLKGSMGTKEEYLIEHDEG
jgi:hypothetical protein